MGECVVSSRSADPFPDLEQESPTGEVPGAGAVTGRLHTSIVNVDLRMNGPRPETRTTVFAGPEAATERAIAVNVP